MKVIFSATDEQVRVEITTIGHSGDAHANDTLLTPEMKSEISQMSATLKPNQIRLKLLVSFKINFKLILSFTGKI
jgi:hypothetical protein